MSEQAARWRGWLAVALGALVVAMGMGLAPHALNGHLSLEAFAGPVAVVLGLALVVAGCAVATRRRTTVERIGVGIAVVPLIAVVSFVVAPAVAATNVPRPPVGATPASRGLEYVSASIETDDGVRLAGWYVPSTTGAAVVLLHGAGATRSDVLDQAAVLAGHGFGVLMIDARGHGDSGGRAMDFGWHGDSDVAAATEYLARRSGVDSRRIGVVGMSMGGEEAIGATAANPQIRAVVAEGATARTADDEEWLSDEFGPRGVVTEWLESLQDVVTDVLTGADVPISLRDAVSTSGDTRYLLITAGTEADEASAAEYIAAGAPDRVRVWTVSDAAHTGGLRTDPEGWEARVIGFLTELLAPPAVSA